MNFLAGLEAQVGKTPYQVYTLKHGIESFEVCIPISKTETFETQMKQPMKNRGAVLEVVRAVGGMLK